MIYTLTGITKRAKYIYYHVCCTFPDGRLKYPGNYDTDFYRHTANCFSTVVYDDLCRKLLSEVFTTSKFKLESCDFDFTD